LTDYPASLVDFAVRIQKARHSIDPWYRARSGWMETAVIGLQQEWSAEFPKEPITESITYHYVDCAVRNFMGRLDGSTSCQQRENRSKRSREAVLIEERYAEKEATCLRYEEERNEARGSELRACTHSMLLNAADLAARPRATSFG
jgi:hypothetical protein